MRKRMVLGCVAVLLLTSCNTKNIDSSFNSIHSGYPDSTIQYIRNNGDFYKNGVIYGNDKAMFLDFDTMLSIPLCSMPNCSHNTSNCLANIVGAEPIIYNNYIYYFNSNNGAVKETKEGPEFYIETKLMRASIGTSEVETICEFNDCAPPQMHGTYALNGSDLYFIGDNLCPYKDEFGVISYSNVGGEHYLCHINLDSGKYENLGSVYDGDKEYEMADSSSGANITGIYKDKMYVQYVFMKESPDKLGITPEENWTRVNFEYDFHDNQLKESTLPAAIYVDNNSYVYLDYTTKETIVISANKTYQIPHFDLYNTFATVFDEKIFFRDSWYDLSDLSEHSLGKYKNYDVVSYYDNCYVMINGGRSIKLTEKELLALDKE